VPKYSDVLSLLSVVSAFSESVMLHSNRVIKKAVRYDGYLTPLSVVVDTEVKICVSFVLTMDFPADMTA